VKGKAILITLLLVVVAVGSYFGYQYFFSNTKKDIWHLVPANAVAVYQPGTCVDCLEKGQHLPSTTLFLRASQGAMLPDSIMQRVMNTLAVNSQLISIHKTDRTGFEYVYYASQQTAASVWLAIEEDLKKRAVKFSKSSRILNGSTIHQVKINTSVITWVDDAAYRAISLSSLLIEDVIRTLQTTELSSFKDRSTRSIAVPSVKNDAGDLHVQLKEFASWLSIFSNQTKNSLFSIGTASLLDIKVDGNAMVLNGFTSIDSADDNTLLSLFKEQTPVPFELKKYISNNALYVVEYGVSDGAAYGKRMATQRGKNHIDSMASALHISATAIDKMYADINQELAIMKLERSSHKWSSVFLIDTKGTDAIWSTLHSAAEATAGDSLFRETFSEYEIQKISAQGVVSLFFPLVHNPSEIYFTQVGKTIMLAAEINVLKELLTDIDEENTWGKSIDKNRFLESTLLESNVSFFVSPSKVESLLSEEMNAEWQTFLATNKKLWRTIGLSAFQLSHLNENFYTNIYITFQRDQQQTRTPSKQEVLITIPQKITSSVFSVKNHNDKTTETLFQDSTHNLYLVGSDGKILWEKKINDPLTGSAHQIDYFINGKLQYLVATEKEIHLIDRLGNVVPNFPIALSFAAHQLTVVDYDHSRKYRFMLTNKKGLMYMTDKEGNLLEGWKGLPSGGELLLAPEHYRIAAKDYIAVVQKSGMFALYSRRGELLNGFPVDLKGRVRSEAFMVNETKLEKAHFVFLLQEGYRVKIGLDGKEMSRETLIKPTTDTQYKLVRAPDLKSYCIVRQNTKQLVILNDELQEIVTNGFVGLNKVGVQYVDFGSGNIFYAVHDQDQSLVYVYDKNGLPLNTQPIDCESISLQWSGTQLKAAIAYSNTLRITVLQ
jgi:hypothetical protein